MYICVKTNFMDLQEIKSVLPHHTHFAFTTQTMLILIQSQIYLMFWFDSFSSVCMCVYI